MAEDKKWTEWTENTSPIDTDLIPMVDDPGGTPLNQKVTKANLLAVCEKSANKDQASGYPSLDANSKVTQDPANATATPTASKIPIADGDGTLDAWITPASVDDPGIVQLATEEGESVTLAATQKAVADLKALVLLAEEKAAASGVASLDETSKVVQDPANATATPAASKIPIADENRTVDQWITRTVVWQVFDAATSVATGDGKAYIPIPADLNGWNLVAAHGVVQTVSSSGTPTVQLYNFTDSVDMLSTRITIDANESSSYSAAAAPVIDTAHDDVASGDLLRVDVDVAGTGTKGLWVILSFRKPAAA